MRIRVMVAAVLVALAAGPADAALLINEIAFNTPSTDAPNEYIELRNTDATDLTIPAGTYLVGIEGDNAVSGVGAGDVQTMYSLGGITVPANGYLVLLQGGNTYTVAAGATTVAGTGAGWTGVAGFAADSGSDIENVSVSFLLINTATPPTTALDIDADNNGVGDGTAFASWTILDSIGILDSDAIDYSYAALTYVRTGGGTGGTVVPLAFEAGYVARRGETTGSTPADWIAAEVTGTAPALSLSVLLSGGVPRTEPAALAGLPLDHLGRANFLNDPPVLTAPAAFTLTEDGTQTFSTGMSTAVTLTDPDVLAAPLEIGLTATLGTVTVLTPAGVTVIAGANGTNTVTITGTLTALTAALDGMVYAAGANATGTATLNIVTSDLGSTGIGGPQIDMDTVTFTLTAVNDAPVVTVPMAQSVVMASTLPFSAAMGNAISVADVDVATDPLAVTATVTAGTLAATASGAAVLTGSGTASIAITGTLTDVNATLDSLVYSAPATQQAVTLTLVANDQGSTGTGGPLSDTEVLNIAVTGTPFVTTPPGPYDFTTSLGGNSPAQSFMIMAGNVNGTVMVTVTAPFQIATASAGPYSLVTMVPGTTGGMLFVRYSPTTGTTHTGMITYVAPGVSPAPTATTLTGTVFRITTASLPDAMVGTAYTATAMAEGGEAPIAWSLQNPPSWLSIDASTGVLSGTPTTDSDPSITIVATDAQTPAQTASITLSLTVTAAPPIDAAIDAPPIDARADAAVQPDAPGPNGNASDGGGCCGTSHAGASWLLALGVVLALRGRRRRSATLDA